jgi:hypothetical protein
MSEARQIAVVNDYAGFMAALRTRADELDVSRETLDAVSGLQNGYCAKLLAPVPIRAIGPTSLGPLLQALGLAIIVVEDLGAFEKIEARLRKRRRKDDAHAAVLTLKRHKPRGVWKGDKAWGKVMTARRLLTLTPARRSRIAKQAARAMWKKRKAAKAANLAQVTVHPEVV